MNENSSLSGSVVNDIQVKVTGEQVSNVVITYQIAYLDKEICGKMIEVLQNAIESATQEYQSIYGDCKFELLQNTMLINVNGFYLEKQKTNIAYLDSYFAKAVELENKLNDEEKIYYQNVYSSSKYQIENTKDKNDMNNISIMTMIQWVIIGILMSIIFWILYFYLRYLADASVKTFRQVKHMNLPIIGLIENRNKKSNWIDNMERKRRIYDSIDYIVKSIGELTDEQILFCIDPSIESEKYFGGILEAKVKNIKMIRLFQMDIGNFELAKKSKGIIFCVCLKNTSIKQMEHELEMCNIHNIEVLGAVVID